jgi:hypothetical protein
MAGVGLAQEQGERAAAVDPRLQPSIDKLEATLAELATLEASLRELDRTERQETAGYREDVALLEAEFQAADRRSAEVDALFDRVNPLVAWGLEEVRASIEIAQRPSALEKYTARLEKTVDLFGNSSGALAESEGAQRLESLGDEVEEAVGALREVELELRMDDVARDIELAGRLYRLRLGLLKALSLEKRIAVHAWAREAPDAVALELDAAGVIARYQTFLAKGFVATLGLKLRNFITAVLAGAVLLRLLVVVLLWRWIQRGRPAFIRRLKARARSIADPQSQRWAVRLAEFLQALAPWAIFLVAVAGFGWAVGTEVSEIPFLSGALALVLAYGIYRLATDVAIGGLLAGMESTGMKRTPELESKLQRSVRWVTRVAAVAGFVVWLIALRLGEGVLFANVRRIGLILVGIVLWLVLRGFRNEVRDVFLALRAHGWLANMVRGSGARASDALVTPIAFLWLCGRSVVGIVRGITFSFRRTRAATAYLSRRRMAKVAEQRGHVEVSVEDLPTGVVEGLDERLSINDLELLDEVPGLETARAAAASWREGKAGGSLLLAGEVGLGKGAWLEHFLTLEGGGERLVLEDRILRPAELRRWLGEQLLGSDGGPMERAELIEGINAGPKRMVVLQGGAALFLATVNGYASLAELGPIIDGTRRQVFWIMTMRGLAWNHLRAAGKELSFLRRKIVLDPWDEDQLTALIDFRLGRAGLEVSYADLMAVDGREEDRASRDRLGKQTFMNLLADFSGGNPQIALHFFLRSLEVDEAGVLRARPFNAPDDESLLGAGNEALFLLAALMRHSTLNVDQAATTTAYPTGRVAGLFLHLLDMGAVKEVDGLYQVATNWRASVLRILRRHNVLIS